MRSLAALLILWAVQDKKEPPKPPVPKIAFAIPLGAVPGKTIRITVRGLNLDKATEVRFAEAVEGAAVTIKSKGKAEMPKEADAALYGDTKLELEVKLPEGASKAALIVVNPAGTTEPYELAVTPGEKLVAEKEPNGGFSQTQPLEAGKVIEGAVGQANDVDAYRIAGRAGEEWVFEVWAHRRGSPLDALLTLYDAAGRTVAVADDGGSTFDPSLRVKLPADGAYALVLLDAHNQGGATHIYHLHARRL